MMYDSTLTDVALEYDNFPTAGVQLSQSSIHQAGQIGRTAIGEQQQWSVYLQALAVFGFKAWLKDCSCPLSLDLEDCTTLLPPLANLLDAACNLRVGDFNLCLIPTGSLGDRWVNLPRAAIELPHFAAHFFVLVEVLEDCASSQVVGVIHRELLLERVTRAFGPDSSSHAFKSNSSLERGDWSYRIPVDWLSYDAEDLLLWLRAADASLLRLPNGSAEFTFPQRSSAQATTERLRSSLHRLQPQLANQPIWQLLNWDQGHEVLSKPEWARWLYRLACGDLNPAMPSQENLEVNPIPSDRALNVGLWLQDRLDALAEELAWVLMPPLSPQMRTVQEDVNVIVAELERDGILVPTHARGAYRSLQLSALNLRLYAFTWPHMSAGNIPEWTLLLVLGPQPGQSLPPNTRLLVRDASQLLVEQISSPELEESYLYAHVMGTWEEKFWVTVEGDFTAADSAVHLPPFKFEPGVLQL